MWLYFYFRSPEFPLHYGQQRPLYRPDTSLSARIKLIPCWHRPLALSPTCISLTRPPYKWHNRLALRSQFAHSKTSVFRDISPFSPIKADRILTRTFCHSVQGRQQSAVSSQQSAVSSQQSVVSSSNSSLALVILPEMFRSFRRFLQESVGIIS
jgi:hypothetical protein